MPGNVAGKATTGTGFVDYCRLIASFLCRRIWLPRPLYAAVPYFYILAGLVAFLATIYVPEWFWVLPHYVLFSGACVHVGFLVFRRRRRKPAAKPIGADSAMRRSTS